MSLTTDKYVKFLTHFKADGECPVCRTDMWSISTAEDGDKVRKVTMPDVDLNHYQAFYTLSCSNCGYTKMFSSSQVEARVEEIE